MPCSQSPGQCHLSPKETSAGCVPRLGWIGFGVSFGIVSEVSEIFISMSDQHRQGEAWHRFRTIVNPVLLQPKIVQLYVDKVDEVTREFMLV